MIGNVPTPGEPSDNVAVPGLPGETKTVTEEIETISPEEGIKASKITPENPLTEVTVTVVVTNSFGWIGPRMALEVRAKSIPMLIWTSMLCELKPGEDPVTTRV